MSSAGVLEGVGFIEQFGVGACFHQIAAIVLIVHTRNYENHHVG